jgi:glycosyltransferase involved in cell wall biosynthesis
MKEKNELDILIPVFNEGGTIIKTIKNILSVVKCNYKMLICYDYDEDPTLGIIRENFPNDRKIIFVKNISQGFNNALISGFNNTKAEAILIFMADDHINHNVINLCYEKFREGYQVICPSRFIKGGKMIGNPFFKAFLTKLASFFYSTLLPFLLRTPQIHLDYFQKN